MVANEVAVLDVGVDVLVVTCRHTHLIVHSKWKVSIISDHAT